MKGSILSGDVSSKKIDISDLKLCIATCSSFPTPGGAEVRFNKYLPGFHERGVDVEVIAGTPSVNKLAENDQVTDWFDKPMGYKFPPVVVNETPVHRVRLPDSHESRRSVFLNRKLVEFFGSGEFNPDIVHLLSLKPRLSQPLLSKLRRQGKGLICSYAIAHKSPPSYPRKKIKEFALRRTYNSFDRLIVASDELKSLMLDLGVTSKIEVIPNGVDVDLHRPVADDDEKRQVRTALNLPRDAFIILGVGSVYPRKGVHLLLKAWHRLVERHPNVEIVWVGRRRDLFDPEIEPYKNLLGELLSEGDAPRKVHMVGQSSDVNMYLKAADLFVFPTEREGMPNAVLEAFSAQLPVILTKYRGYSELIGKAGRDYILIDRKVEEIESAIEDLIADRPRRLELGENARRFVEHRMPISRSIDMHVDVYREVLDNIRSQRSGSRCNGWSPRTVNRL